MIRIRRLFWPTLFGVLGIAALVHGVDVLTGQEVTCGGQVMRSGDTCVTTTYERGRPSSTRTSDMDTQRVDNRIDGYLTAVGGPVVALLSGFVLYRRVRGERPPRQSRAVGRDCRAALAAIRGWRFVPHEPGLLRWWSKGPLSLWAFPDAYDVVSGLVDGV